MRRTSTVTTRAGRAPSTSSRTSSPRRPDMASIRIYGVPPSTFTRAVRMGCHEKGIDYELVPTFPGTVEPYNPLRKIPAMQHGELTLFESAAILRYLDNAFPGPKLWPSG